MKKKTQKYYYYLSALPISCLIRIVFFCRKSILFLACSFSLLCLYVCNWKVSFLGIWDSNFHNIDLVLSCLEVNSLYKFPINSRKISINWTRSRLQVFTYCFYTRDFISMNFSWRSIWFQLNWINKSDLPLLTVCCCCCGQTSRWRKKYKYT